MRRRKPRRVHSASWVAQDFLDIGASRFRRCNPQAVLILLRNGVKDSHHRSMIRPRLVSSFGGLFGDGRYRDLTRGHRLHTNSRDYNEVMMEPRFQELGSYSIYGPIRLPKCRIPGINAAADQESMSPMSACVKLPTALDEDVASTHLCKM